MLSSRDEARARLAAVLACAAAAATGLGGCANVAAPPGGPPDSVPPMLIAVRPDSFAVVPDFDGRVVFEFDESISEREIQAAVILFPYQRRPDVDKGKRELKVKPRGGWVTGRIYHIGVNPVVQDLFNNRIPRPIQHIISTGPPIPENAVQGTVFDRLTGRPLPGGRVDMVQMPDTLRYGSRVDSVGGFLLSWLPPGEYLAIGYEDRNNNSRADNLDRTDTLRVALGLGDTLSLEFQVFQHDTLPPALAEVEPIDSVTLELTFDAYLDPDAPLDTTSAEIYSLFEDEPVPLERVMHVWRYEAWQDSMAAARAAAADTLTPEGVQPDTVVPGREVRAREPPAVAVPLPTQVEDTAAAAVPRRLPARRIYVIAGAPIPPGEVRVRVRGMVGLSGLVGDDEITFDQPVREESPPEAPPPEDEPPGG